MIRTLFAHHPQFPSAVDAARTLKRLPGWLAREGYVDAFAIYGSYNSRSENWARDLHLLPPRVQLLFRLFLLGQAVSADELFQIIPAEDVNALASLSILHGQDGSFHAGTLAAVPINGFLIFTDRPSVNPAVYFGEDSAALAAHLFPPAGGDCLDLCSGSGVQALLASARARRVVAVEINPVAAAYAHLNIVMNDAEDRVEVRTADLYAGAPDADFDFISANPPLLPFPEDLPYPFVGHGGADGLAVTRRIIAGLPRALRPTGLCQIIGTCLGDASGPACETELARTAQELALNIVMTIPTAQPLAPGSRMFEGMAWSCSKAADLPLEHVRNRLAQHLLRLGADQLDLFFLAISRAHGPGKLRIARLHRELTGFWFV